jgi:hypothetical protein
VVKHRDARSQAFKYFRIYTALNLPNSSS